MVCINIHKPGLKMGIYAMGYEYMCKINDGVITCTYTYEKMYVQRVQKCHRSDQTCFESETWNPVASCRFLLIHWQPMLELSRVYTYKTEHLWFAKLCSCNLYLHQSSPYSTFSQTFASHHETLPWRFNRQTSVQLQDQANSISSSSSTVVNMSSMQMRDQFSYVIAYE